MQMQKRLKAVADPSRQRRMLLLRLLSLCLFSFSTTHAWIGPSSSGAIRSPTFLSSSSPRKTENGGYTHTDAAKAKISAANKGKSPWNKGRERSPEVRAKIAESTRRAHREKFLKKLQEQGLTEEEYHAQKEAEAQAKLAQRTANGGIRHSEETKAKISHGVKLSYASGQRKKPTVPKRGNRDQHSEETRRKKISETMRLRWAENPATFTRGKRPFSLEQRQRISATLKKKWEDPEFRQRMKSARKRKMGEHG